MTTSTIWITFRTWTGLEAKYKIDAENKLHIKLVSKMPKRFYYSAMNEIGEYFDEVIEPKLNDKNTTS